MADEKVDKNMEMTPLNKDVEAAEENTDDPQVQFLPKENLKKDDLFSSPEIQFSGMSKEELVKFENDPFYKKLRLFLFIAFWIIWIGLLVAVIIIIVVSPKCPHRPVQQFWEKDATYKIEVKSFYGVGENVENGNIKGVEEKLDYLKSLNVRNILLSSLVKTDNIGSVVDFESVNPIYGTLEDLHQLIKKARKQEMRILMELDVSYTSKNHSWFKSDDYYKYYISENFNNVTWYSRDGNSAFTLKGTQFYYSGVLSGEPSLDFSKQEVVDLILKSMKFWLDQGISGFCLQNTAFIFGRRSKYLPTPALPTEIVSSPLKNWYGYDQSVRLFQPESLEFVVQLRRLLNEVQKDSDKPRALFVDVGNLGFPPKIEQIFQYYGNKTNEGAHVVLNQQLANSIQDLVQAVNETNSAANAIGFSTSYLTAGSYLRRVKEFALVGSALLLPGSPFLYYGQELGMQTDIGVYAKIPLSPLSSAAKLSQYPMDDVDACQSIPMQWDDQSSNAGILPDLKKKLTWFKLAARQKDLSDNNYRKLSSYGYPSSTLTFLTMLLKLRTTKESLLFGQLIIDPTTSSSENLLIFSRQAKGFSSYVIALNMDTQRDYTRDLTFAGGRDANAAPLKGTVKFIQAGLESSHKENSEVVLDKVYVPKGPSLLVISY